ncbi:MAG: hypothetical protein JKY55_01045, partial [Aliivibrio sp.]|uniref:hypothetical protein n=1 Tax=Aliivibrio sp. TaxID=1872443 RepID=UPI001A54D37C|nr:hypothetical protein [Aliivibrio sp.]
MTNITLFFPTQKSFKDSVFATHLGKKRSAFMCKGHEIQLYSGLDIKIRLEVSSSQSIHKKYETIIGYNLSGLNMSRFNQIKNANSIVYFTASESDGVDWASIWSPDIWCDMGWKFKSSILPSQLISQLERISRLLNPSMGFVHKIDKDIAKRFILKLKNEDLHFKEEDVASWAIKNGWPTHHAKPLARLVFKCLSV